MSTSCPVTVAFATLGCKLNQAETQEMRGLLESRGFREVPFEAPAQVYVINTCTVTGRADFSDRQTIRRAIARNPEALVVVTGCYAQTDPGAIARIPGVGLILGNQEKYELAGLLDALGNRVRPLVRVSDVSRARAVPVAPFTRLSGRSRAFVKVQDGCQHRCAFCIVPYARGPSRSQAPERVVEQVQRLVDSGYREVVLTGVDMGHYGWDLLPRTTLAGLLRLILREVRGLNQLRLSSILPAYFTPELIEVVSGSPVIAPHLHVPLQSGSDRILRLMRRPYNTSIYTRLVETLSKRIPELALGTDLIVGFPGETEADFAGTRALVQALPFSYLHVFAYSDRKGTEAARLPDRVPSGVIHARSRELRTLGGTKSLEFRKTFLGRSLDLLVLETRDRASGLLAGLSGNYIEVLFDGPDELMGGLASVAVADVQPGRTFGTLLGAPGYPSAGPEPVAQAARAGASGQL
ncbi:MAG: tRNA (N(6)-L-threonylcarbamoyladenosine(37)-C(2))-methylthiotransferase MtaB [Candidatus Rokubacteria bacterium]|nr:tRNA (N(6)-L-threonylcarbamoyladenosine(37)-C(2))-methylthiotransferase MtaB [Candidatus Rokubacteria bacterium]